MKDLRIRLLYPQSVKHEEVKAALKGFERFREFGVLYDHAVVDDKYSLRGVKNARAVKGIITADEPVVPYYAFMPGISEIFFPKDVIPFGLTPHRITELVDNGLGHLKGEPRIGVARQNEGAVVSLFRVRQLDSEGRGMAADPYRATTETNLGAKAIEVAVSHMLGNVCGKREHCPTAGCIMQENENYIDFIERFVKQKVDFCRDCSSKIRSSISRLMFDY